ncbi:hypothetical protein AAG906_010566 [Vitis piasezkii]
MVITSSHSLSRSSQKRRKSTSLSHKSLIRKGLDGLGFTKEQILATQAQHTAILRQIQHHLGSTSAPEHAIPSSSEPPTGEAVGPSFPQHHSTSLRRYHFLPIFQSLLSH